MAREQTDFELNLAILIFDIKRIKVLTFEVNFFLKVGKGKD